jgi:formate hydrogenlyase subunit 3/multisubunit Na+/H+ antiporter MnhD subunit
MKIHPVGTEVFHADRLVLKIIVIISIVVAVVVVYSTLSKRGTRWRSWLRHCATSRVRFPVLPFEFFIGIILPAAP